MVWNYLRVRGEYSKHSIRLQRCWELPPRARRIPNSSASLIESRGTTSACAENTAHSRPGTRRIGNYLRVRGEYPKTPTGSAPKKELPPRARRILSHADNATGSTGTTSACAENTKYNCPQPTPPEELPPRARRIRLYYWGDDQDEGTTSACAENTRYQPHPFFHAGNYLRVRGEYRLWYHVFTACTELPPRARRIRFIETLIYASVGTTSACAENTDGNAPR